MSTHAHLRGPAAARLRPYLGAVLLVLGAMVVALVFRRLPHANLSLLFLLAALIVADADQAFDALVGALVGMHAALVTAYPVDDEGRLGLPDMDGLDDLRRIREWSAVPIVVLSARSDASDKVTALDEGANDYVTKPFSITELMGRLRVMLRTAAAGSSKDAAEFRCGDLRVDLVKRRIYQADEELYISRKEYELLRLLVTHAGQVLTHQQILRGIWGPTHVADIHCLRVLVGSLRQKLGDDPSKPHYIHTIQGVGYRLSD